MSRVKTNKDLEKALNELFEEMPKPLKMYCEIKAGILLGEIPPIPEDTLIKQISEQYSE